MNKTQRKRYLYLLKFDRFLEGSCADSIYCDEFKVFERDLKAYRQKYESRSRRRLSDRKWAKRHGFESAYNVSLKKDGNI